MNTAVDLDKAKEIAEQYLDTKSEASIFKKMLNQLFDGVDVEVEETLANGGSISYKITQPKEKFDYVSYANFLVGELKKGKKYSDEELNSLKHNFVVQKSSKWVLKISK